MEKLLLPLFLMLQALPPMIKKILFGYTSVLANLFRFLILLMICSILSIFVVFPLWKLATTNTLWYTLLLGTVICSILLYFIIKKSIALYKKSSRLFFIVFFRRLVFIFGLISTITFVLKLNHIAAILSLFLSLIVYGMLAFGFSTNETKQS